MNKPTNDIAAMARAAAQEAGEGLSVRQYWNVLRKRIWSVFFVSALVVGLGVLFLANQIDVYEAMTTVEIRTEAPQVLGGDVEPVMDPIAGGGYWTTEEYYETQYRVIRSRAVAEEVVRSMQLAEDLEFLGIEETDPEAVRAALDASDPVSRLIGMTTVSPVADSHLVRIRVEHADANFAADVANMIASVYVERNQRRQLRKTDEAFLWLEEEREALQARVAGAEVALYNFRDGSGIGATSIASRQEQLTAHLNSLNGLLDEARARTEEVRAERRIVRRARQAEHFDGIAVPAVIENSLIQSLKGERDRLQTELARLEARYGELQPDVRGVTEALERTEAAIWSEVAAVLDSYDLQVRRAEARLDDLDREREAVLAEMRLLSAAEPRYNQLVRDVENNADVLAMIERRYKETDLYRRQRDVNNIEVLDAAIVPTSPIRPRKRLIMAATLIFGLFLGVGFAFLLETLDNAVRTQEDIERVLGFTFLGVVPSIRNRIKERLRAEGAAPELGQDVFVHNYPKSSVAECCRSIRTNLHFMSPDKELNRLLVTSAGPREGKTSTAVSLATVMAQSDRKVLLLDTDMRRPRIHKALGLRNDVGLSNLILGEVDYDEAIQATVVPNLYVMACGPIPPNPTELMHTERFREITDELARRFDRLLFDSPPVIAVADALILAGEVDGVLFVVKAGQTSKDVVKRAKQQLEATNAPLLGAILNDLDLEDRAYRYHYYYSYYYRYGQYYEDEPEFDEGDPAGA